MNILDRISLNRLINILTNFILGILKIFAPKPIDTPKPPRRKILPWKK